MTTAIETKYIGPTNFKPSRIKAFTRAEGFDGKRPPSLYYGIGMAVENMHQSHINAAKALAEKLGWSGYWVVGDTHAGIVAVRMAGDYIAGIVASQGNGFYIPPPHELSGYDTLFKQGEMKIKIEGSIPTSSDSEND